MFVTLDFILHFQTICLCVFCFLFLEIVCTTFENVSLYLCVLYGLVPGNVVWADSISAARALTKLSISQESLVSAGLGQSLPDVSQKNLGKETQTKEDMDENSNTSIVSSGK